MKTTSIAYVDGIIKDKPIVPEKIRQIQVASAQDKGILLAMKFCLYGWPERHHDIPESTHKFFSARPELSVSKGNADLWQSHHGTSKVTPYNTRENSQEALRNTQMQGACNND